ncbi:uncharacterized protein A1O9_09396 [Exophiala aquamarina CBS 119918]|uniref:Uncharacterized protein n=1 Tax=Exophiala aquamarina CBS 119918 TaxID=1182545 RepID=A0A072PF95_9EURO|nr:uncharacterized protein A1O9_09396 [Exophiala aquamarina CBS 119918]KEF54230.1 hypothetical protein A1O9_09396 [Exophiala aquamarina CBS 119918]
MKSYPSQTPSNGSSFTEVIHSDTYPFIDSKTRSNLTNWAVFITGGNRGVGKAITLSFARAGAKFIGLGCNDGFGNTKNEIQSIAKNANRIAPEVHCLLLDVTDRGSVSAAAAQI